jgi:hypothetical protein
VVLVVGIASSYTAQMDGFLGVENEQIGRYGSLEAVQLFGDLLWAEARRLGIAPEIRISEKVNTADGGIDASANNGEVSASDLIRTGYSGYQIKTGTTFALTEGKLKKEFFGQGHDIKKENLGESVRRCLDMSGHLTFVCFGIDPVESQVNTAHDLVTGWLKTCGYPDASVRFWGQATIKRFLTDFPSLRLKVNGHGTGIFEIFESWKGHGDMQPDILSLGEKQEAVIEEARSQLLTNIEAIHLRITGASGVGKTRLALEALSDKRLRSLVIYTDRPQELEAQGFFGHVGMPDNNMQIILVLDECSLDDAGRYWNRLQGLGRRIRLITIYNEEYAAHSGSTRSIVLPPLEEAQVAEILRQYNIPPEHLARWASICKGSPRYAKILGENIRSNSKDLLADPDTIPIVNRYIAGRDNPADQSVKDRILIMRFLSLFKRFGYQQPVAGEADAIYELIHEYDSSISRARFDQSIRDLHDRRILQGEHTYYITPKPLQIKLWVEWWDYHSTTFTIERFNKLPPPLVEGFNDMFRFAQESEAALRTVERLLGPDGPFADGTLLQQERGGTFFLALTEGAPEKALERLEATIGSWNKEQLLAFKTGRRGVIWALQRIAVWEGLFSRAMRLLQRLSEAENDNVYSNNATGIFREFFSLMAATEERPSKRLPIIEELLRSGEEAKEALGLKAVETALEDHFTRMIGSEYQGLRREPKLWLPDSENWQEAHDYVMKMWDFLIEALVSDYEANRKEAAQSLCHELEVRGRIPQTSGMALDTARQVFKENKIERNKLIEVVVHILHYGKDDLPEDVKKPWQEFYNELVPDDLSSLINRYVGLNLLEDLFETGAHSEEKRNQMIKELATRAYENTETFRKELTWLVTARAGNGYLFAYELGKLDTDRKLLPEILEARRTAPAESNPSQYFLGGYLRTIFEADAHEWESLFDKLSQDEVFLPLTPELVWRAGITDTVMEQLITLTENSSVNPVLLAHFKYGVEIRDLGEDIFKRLVRSLLSHKTKTTTSIALDIFSRYYRDEGSKHEMPGDLTLELLKDPTFFTVSEGRSDTMDDFNWAQVAEKFLDKYGSEKGPVLELGLLMLDNIGNDGSILDHADRYVKSVLSRISEMYPDEMWMRALTLLEEKGYFIFKRWLGSNEFFQGSDTANLALLEKIKLDTLWEWIEQDIEKRAWFIAALVPNTFSNTPGEVCLAREVLIRYGDREDVRRNLTANFYSGGWSGKTSDYYRRKLADAEAKKQSETDQKVIRWLDEYVGRLRKSIEEAKIGEERDDFWA